MMESIMVVFRRLYRHFHLPVGILAVMVALDHFGLLPHLWSSGETPPVATGESVASMLLVVLTMGWALFNLLARGVREERGD